ncbi:hypothetical protein F2P79_001888 [Pimephales promelas]|nr:hypothetical protein F2P79_001888 [Pimephales promelas]
MLSCFTHLYPLNALERGERRIICPQLKRSRADKEPPSDALGTTPSAVIGIEHGGMERRIMCRLMWSDENGSEGYPNLSDDGFYGGARSLQTVGVGRCSSFDLRGTERVRARHSGKPSQSWMWLSVSYQPPKTSFSNGAPLYTEAHLQGHHEWIRGVAGGGA